MHRHRKTEKVSVIGQRTPNSACFVILCLSIMILTTTICAADEIDDLVPAIIQIESGGRADAVSSCGAIGLMQITPIVLKEFNDSKVPNEGICTYRMVARGERIHEGRLCYKHYFLKDLYIPEKNIEIGTWYLRRLKDHYIPKDKFSIELLCACYNAGPTKMRKLNWDISKSPKETRDYIRKVLKIYRRLK